jgi:hypothetical protein
VIIQAPDERVEQVRPVGPGGPGGPGLAYRLLRNLDQREEPAGRVPGLGDAVGVEQQLVAAADRDHARPAPPVGQVEQPKRRRGVQLDERRRTAAQQQRRRMPAAHELGPGLAGLGVPGPWLLTGDREVRQQRGDEPFRVLRTGDQGVQPDRDAGQAGLGTGQGAPGVQDGQAGLVGGQAAAHHVADEQPDTERGGHHVMDIATAALGGGQMARFDIQPTDTYRDREGHGGNLWEGIARV